MTVAVVGAGISGLLAAYRLQQKGHDVHVYEARKRVGGRILTIKSPAGAFEAGAEWIDGDNHLMLALVKELGLELQEPNLYPGCVYFNGEQSDEKTLWPDVKEAMDALSAEVATLAGKADTISPERSLGPLIAKCAKTERAKWYLETVIRSDEGDLPQNIALRPWIEYQSQIARSPSQTMSQFRVKDGMGAICLELEKRLDHRVHLGKALRTVDADSDKAQLWFDGEMIFADHVVLTLPPTCMHDIEWPIDFPAERIQQFQLVGSAPATKLSMQFSKVDWIGSEGLRMMADSPLMQIWSALHGENLLTAYVTGEEAAYWTRTHTIDEAPALELEKFLPGAFDNWLATQIHAWHDEPYTKMGFSHQKPGEDLFDPNSLAQPHGRIHFAGEHTNSPCGFLESAVASAERVAEEIAGGN